MKTILSIIALAATLLSTSCGNNSSTKETEVKNNDPANNTATANSNEVRSMVSTNDILTHYLALKNALTNDNGSEAASHAKELGETLGKVDGSGLTTEQKKVYDDVKDDIKEHAEHISSNGSNIAHQREHFDMLSKDMIDLVKATGTAKTLFRDFCPMYNNKKGASWLSETKEIKNPYYGTEMPKCGIVKEEIKPKG